MSLTSAVSDAIADPAKLARARKNARKQAERFDIEGLSEQLWHEYEERARLRRRAERSTLAAAATI